MRLGRNLLIGAAAGLAVSALPFSLEPLALGSFQLSPAYAKSGGNGNGKGGGGGHGGSGARGKSADAGGHGKSVHGKSGNVRTGTRQDRLLGAVFGKETKADKRRGQVDVKTARSAAKSLRKQEVAALPDTVSIPEENPKEQKLQARLAGLNSLKRNYHAYLNSKSPRMASIRDFVMAQANLDIAQTGFQDLLDGTVYDGLTRTEMQERLQERLDELQETPEDTEAQAEVDALTALLESPEADALVAAEEQLADAPTLEQALLDAANKNRVAQYGEENYVNDDVMQWAEEVLGVGDTHYGKIDQVRETLETD